MKNIKLERDGTRLVITVDLSATGEPSKSGKSTVIGSTQGNQRVPGTTGVMIGVNCYAYPEHEIE